ncbi:RNA polymerase sigma factor [Capsulimonas corticalis]|uniref:RNA polymerase sigma factor n=1 Tax=Capsulimonas corticalis TaxID=2219043 RepID=A0A402D2I6_9BACT|nr:sigma-70 family RNA polymerase sigma factor [Capsulimonas corticalis]BDI29989.1 RNA polymerase sigma factor [Capsulimonas corticalis]
MSFVLQKKLANAPQARGKLYVSPEEKAIIERCKQGDLAAFNELVKRYEKPVYNFAYRLTGSYDDANDVAQDAFVRVFNAIGSFRGDASFTTWLFRITTNVFLDERKKAKAHPQTSLDEQMELGESAVARQIEDPGPSPEDLTEEAERGKILQDAVSSLPEYQRTMVVLYHSQQKSYEEIAEIMDLPIGTVKSRLNRARLALKEKLTPLRELFNA